MGSPSVSFVNVKAHPCEWNGDVTDYIEAIDWVTTDHIQRNQNGSVQKSVINMSLVSNAYSPLDEAAIRAVDAGVAFVAAAGNGGTSDACSKSPGRIGDPANVPNNANGLSIISVAGSDRYERFWGVSSSGPCVDILAPADEIQAYQADGTVDTYIYGTSVAAPHVAGVVAMHLERYGAVSPGMLETTIKENAIVGALTQVPTGTPNLLLYSGVSTRRRSCCF